MASYEDKDYSLAVWDVNYWHNTNDLCVSFYLVHKDTNSPLLNDDGSVKEFRSDNYIDCSHLSEGIDLKDLTEVKETD